MTALNPHQAYRQQQLGTDDPLQLLLATYDAGLRACRTNRRGLLIRVLEELVGSLDVSQGPVAMSLLQLYEYLMHEAREGRLEEVEAHLRELRMAWEQASPGPTPSA